ncbi:MAG: hypothetical protein H7282_05615 [Cytophagaceae bacterium]|nr:hypothetical protein [Cytophagaceae bacterium]
MKKIIFALVTLCMAGSTQATAPVPEKIQHNFVEQFPQASDMVWTDQQNGLYEVDFNYNKQHYAALLDKEGTMVHAGITLTWFEFPASVRQSIAKSYEGFNMKLMIKQNDHYVAEFSHQGSNYMVVLDNTGKVVVSSKE